MNERIWATTNTGAIWHAFTEDGEGPALCHSRIYARTFARMNDDFRTLKGAESPLTNQCERCVAKFKALAAEATPAPVPAPATEDTADGPTLAERAGVRYATVGKGKRVHFSPNDDTLCGRVITEYISGSDLLALLNKGHELCARCTTVAEQRANSRALAAASPLAAAAVDLAETVEQAAPPAGESAPAPRFLVDPWTWIRRPSSSDAAKAAEERAERRQQLADARGANAHELAVDAVRRVVHELPQAGALRVRVTEGSPEATLTRDDLHALAYSGHTTADAVTRVRAAVAAHIRHGEREVHLMFPALGMRPALYLPDVMALLRHWEITQAEAAEGTWRGAWIGEQPTDGALFNIEQPVEQGALFSDRATDATHPPERRVIEGRVVAHNGKTKGTAPEHSTDPDALAAVAAVGELRLAEVTDHTDITAQPDSPDHTPDAWGFLAEPRGNGRVALYWLSAGQYVRPDGEPWVVELKIGADKLRKAGWTIEPHTRRCVMAWRPIK
ncbi:hypothetical protein ACIQU6_38810 [Streptomyces sp. NPDC090442]|uniref:hypothetical protein n=1 Tax=Streptomyces sp. NPDC090442 TaxID=3365962 RepID=UPI0037F1509B